MPQLENEGSFKAKVIGKDYCRSKNGSEQLAVRFEVTADVPQKGQHITEFLSFSDAALKYTVEKMRTMGWQGVDLADIETLGSSEVEIVVRMEHQEGYEPRLRVAFINQIGGGGVSVKALLSEQERKAFAAKMRGLIVGIDPSKAKAARPVPVPPQRREDPPHPATSDDIPF